METAVATKGILVDTWHYAHKAVDRPSAPDGGDGGGASVTERKVEIRVRILKKTREAAKAPHVTASVSFEAECREPAIRISGTDIEAIRKAVFSILDEALAIRWAPYLLVRVERPHIFEGQGSGAEVTWTDVWRGTAWDGTELLREFNRYSRPGEDIYTVSPWPGVFTAENGRVLACIPATDRNRAAMLEFVARLDQLRKLLAGFLSPERIQQTLANLSGVAFLPPPAGPEDDDT